MITATGYSKDPSIMPEGIAITFGQDMAKNNGGMKTLLSCFLQAISTGDEVWMQKCSKLPKVDVQHVYIIVNNRLWGRANFAWLEKSEAFAYTPNDPGTEKHPRIVLAGPFERCPFKRTLKGFQGFRYTTKLF